MLVSLTSTTTPALTTAGADASELGFLLHKHPDRLRSVDVGFGMAHVFYPESSAERCTATLFVEVDPVGLSRAKGRRSQGLEPYVNDRPYVASSMLSVAIGRLFGSALAGSCATRPELVDRELALEVELPVVPVRGGPEVVCRLFEPLGYDVVCTAIALDDRFPQWGDSRYLAVKLIGRQTVRHALEHLFVLLPVLDDKKHHWIDDSEIDKLLSKGADWLPSHPETDLITRRYLRFGGLAREALAQLNDALSDGLVDVEVVAAQQDKAEEEVERPLSLNQLRMNAVLDAVRASGGARVVDLGCGEGRLLQLLVKEASVTELLGVDVSVGALERAERRLGLDEMSERKRERVRLVQGALTYLDDRIKGFDVATVIEVIEHLDLDRLDAFGRAVFGHARPGTVIVTTPNREYNANFEGVGATGLRHGDHRFEWTRAEFAAWVGEICETNGYQAEMSGIGNDDPELGAPTQMVVLRR